MPGYGYDNWDPTLGYRPTFDSVPSTPSMPAQNYPGNGGRPTGWDGVSSALNDVLEWLFGRSKKPGQITSSPLPPPAGATAMNPQSPFTVPPPQAPAPTAPVTKLASAADIARKISGMVGAPQEPPPVSFPPATMATPDAHYLNAADSGPHRTPIRMQEDRPAANSGVRGATPQLAALAAIPGALPALLGAALANTGRRGDAASYGPDAAGIVGQGGGSPFGGLSFDNLIPDVVKEYMPQLRAEGGQIHGYMRGGYPDLYTAPVRRTFDSGGESYVGAHYGDSDGRADDVNARLSPREYVVDAETMSLLGDGNPDAGAKKMDKLRENVRKHKGKALAKGKFSPNAKKSAAEYLAHDGISAGLRHRGRDKG